MYIPTQEERYRKVADITLLLCVILPSGVVYWAYGAVGGEADLAGCLLAFLMPVAYVLETVVSFQQTAALCFSAAVQGAAYFWLARRTRMKAKTKLTVAVTWGMLFALILRMQIYHYFAVLQA